MIVSRTRVGQSTSSIASHRCTIGGPKLAQKCCFSVRLRAFVDENACFLLPRVGHMWTNVGMRLFGFWWCHCHKMSTQIEINRARPTESRGPKLASSQPQVETQKKHLQAVDECESWLGHALFFEKNSKHGWGSCVSINPVHWFLLAFATFFENKITTMVKQSMLSTLQQSVRWQVSWLKRIFSGNVETWDFPKNDSLDCMSRHIHWRCPLLFSCICCIHLFVVTHKIFWKGHFREKNHSTFHMKSLHPYWHLSHHVWVGNKEASPLHVDASIGRTSANLHKHQPKNTKNIKCANLGPAPI